MDDATIPVLIIAANSVFLPYRDRLVIPPTRPSLDPLPQSIQSARLSLQSSELAPLTHKRVLPPLWFPGGTHWLAGEGVGGANSDEGTDNLVL